MSDTNFSPMRVVQLTDTHLGGNHGEKLMGLDTDYSLSLVVDKLMKERGASDLLLATGDIANNASIDAYKRFYSITEAVAEQCFWLPGNHDNVYLMSEGFGQPWLQNQQLGDWQFIMLDSSIAGKPGGELHQDQLDLLDKSLAESTANHSFICLHHHPILCGANWLDDQVVRNRDVFFEILDRYPKVRAVLWGHIHQKIDQERNGVKLMATPSTCIQFAPGSKGFKLDPQGAAYRWFELYNDGRIETGVSRVEEIFALDYDDSNGY